MRMRYLLPVLLLASPAAALAADADPQSDQASAPAPEPAKEKMICKTSKATGSLTRRKRVCQTAAQWNRESERARKSVDDIAGNAYRRVGDVIPNAAPGL